jgi:hypothetical protein
MANRKKPVGGSAPEPGGASKRKATRKAGARKLAGAGKGSRARPAADVAAPARTSSSRPKAPAPRAARGKAVAAPEAAAAASKARTRPATRASKPAGTTAAEARPKAARKATTAKARPAARTRALRKPEAQADPPRAVPGLSEEDQIRAAKYLPRELPKRLFEEERFLFPESYGQNRIRLLVRDPEWIFAYWDVKPETLTELAKSLGERALALSRLTLRVVDPVSGGSTDILLPPGARWWYVRTDAARRTYRAELGVTLPSGQFRRLAESNTVVTPRVGPSPEAARRRMSYREAGELLPAEAAAARETERAAGLAAQPWEADSVDGAAADAAAGTAGTSARTPRGGASDAFRPGGASDVFRR